MEKKDNSEDLEQLISGLHKREPVLRDPEGLTEDIMRSLTMKSIQRKSGETQTRPNRGLTIMLRLLAAASVCLFLVFTYEQYVVVDKIGRMEMRNAAISQNKKYGTAIKINQAIALLKSDPDILRHYQKLHKEKANKISLLKAAILFDLLTIAGNDSINQNLTK